MILYQIVGIKVEKLNKYFGGLVIMGAHVLCKHEVGVRSSHPPPFNAGLDSRCQLAPNSRFDSLTCAICNCTVA